MHYYCVTHSRNLHVLFLFAVLSGHTFFMSCNAMTRGRAGKERAEEEEEEEGRGYIHNISLLCSSLVAHVSLSALQDPSSLN